MRNTQWGHKGDLLSANQIADVLPKVLKKEESLCEEVSFYVENIVFVNVPLPPCCHPTEQQTKTSSSSEDESDSSSSDDEEDGHDSKPATKALVKPRLTKTNSKPKQQTKSKKSANTNKPTNRPTILELLNQQAKTHKTKPSMQSDELSDDSSSSEDESTDEEGPSKNQVRGERKTRSSTMQSIESSDDSSSSEDEEEELSPEKKRKGKSFHGGTICDSDASASYTGEDFSSDESDS